MRPPVIDGIEELDQDSKLDNALHIEELDSIEERNFLASMRFHPIGGGPEDDKDGQEAWFTGENRIPYWIDRSLPGLAGPDYDATISFGLPFELGDSQYGESRLKGRQE